MAVQIRRATNQDVQSLAELYVEFHNFHASGLSTRLVTVEVVDDRLRSAINQVLADPRAAIFVATVCEGVVGLVEVYLKETEPDAPVVQRRYAYLQSLAVTAPRRYAGVGTQLVKAAQQWAHENGATEIEVETWEFPAGPLRFYERLGYQTLKRQLVKRLP
ncbi:MAG: N-acetyltransferase family protein [Mycobacterium leprae]